MSDTYSCSQHPRSDSPEPPHAPKQARKHWPPHLSSTPQRLLLQLSRLRAQLRSHPAVLTALFLLTYAVHTILLPLSSATDPSSTSLAAALMLWSVFFLFTAREWWTSKVLGPLWISLVFRGVFGLTGTYGAHPLAASVLLAGWGAAVYIWLTSTTIVSYGNGSFLAAAARRELQESISQRLSAQEAATRQFCTEMLTFLGRTGGDYWTLEQLQVFRPATLATRDVAIAVDAAKGAVERLLDDLDALKREAGGRGNELGEELVIRWEVLRVLVGTTITIWEELYIELMHPPMGEERPEIGERLPRRVFRAMRWFTKVEEQGVGVLVVERLGS